MLQVRFGPATATVVTVTAIGGQDWAGAGGAVNQGKYL
jgi:hypothetical protein